VKNSDVKFEIRGPTESSVENAVFEIKRSIERIKISKSTKKPLSKKHKIKDTITISNEYVGRIIGKGGQVDINSFFVYLNSEKNIYRLQLESNCQITIDSSNENSDDSQVTVLIIGMTVESVSKAKTEILNQTIFAPKKVKYYENL